MTNVHEREKNLYLERTRRSAEIFHKARQLTPYGVHSNYKYVEPHPLYCAKGKGSKIWDVDGNEYVDFNMAFGALVVGHAHPTIIEAIRERIENGTLLGFECEDAHKLAELICRRFNVEMVKFSSTGLEGTAHAIRFARAYTGRKKILKFEGCYHGSHDGLLVSVKPSKQKAGDPKLPNQVPASQGIPEEITSNTLVAPFNDLEAIEAVMKRNGEETAAIILEPIPMNMGFITPSPGFLEGLRELANEYSSLLIFDEIKTCGKFYHGAAGYFRVQPDLSVMSKAISGGYPLSVIAGRKPIMEKVAPGVVAHAGTFNANPLSITAAKVTLGKVLDENGFNQASRLGDDLARGCQDIIKDFGITARVQWLGISGAILFSREEVANWRSFLECDFGKWNAYYIAMLNRGIIPAGTGADEQWTISVQHSKDDVEAHLEVFKEVAPMLKRQELSMGVVEAV